MPTARPTFTLRMCAVHRAFPAAAPRTLLDRLADRARPGRPLALLSGRASDRRRREVADGLCAVARRAAGGRRQYEMLLISRATSLRSELLEVAALVRCSSNPDPECLAELHELLTSGLDSPLYNRRVPAGQLAETLNRARDALGTPPSAVSPTQRSRLVDRP
jgi:hypothetical protein